LRCLDLLKNPAGRVPDVAYEIGHILSIGAPS
jgi:hypothetical protein